MVKTTFVEKDNKMCLKVREKNKDGKVVARYVSSSNFVFNPVAQVGGAKDGYLMEVHTYPGKVNGNGRTAFCPSNPKKDDFVFYLNRALHSNGGGGLTCSLSENIFKSQFVKKVLEFQNSRDYVYRLATKTLGKVPNERIWVLSDEIQIDEFGQLIEERNYIYVPDDPDLQLNLSGTLTSGPLKDALPELEATLKQNFPAALFTLGAACLACHAELIEEKFDGCPATIIVGQPGRGKSTALKLALSSIGMLKSGLIKTFSKEKILHRASSTTMGVYIDDPVNVTACKELVVDFFNRASTGTIARGVESIHCGLMMTSNDVLSGTSRELRRIVYIPFLGDSVAGSSPEDVRAYVMLKQKINSKDLSGAVGAVIHTGIEFANGGWEDIVDTYIDNVRQYITDGLPDIALPYATLLWFTEKICHNIMGSDIFNEILLEYFVSGMAPFIKKHQPNAQLEMETSLYSSNDEHGGSVDVLECFKSSLVETINSMGEEETSTFVKMGNKEGRKCILVRAPYFQKANASQSRISTLVTKAGIGASQSRRFEGRRSKPERCVLIFLDTFTEEQQRELNGLRMRGENSSNRKADDQGEEETSYSEGIGEVNPEIQEVQDKEIEKVHDESGTANFNEVDASSVNQINADAVAHVDERRKRKTKKGWKRVGAASKAVKRKAFKRS